MVHKIEEIKLEELKEVETGPYAPVFLKKHIVLHILIFRLSMTLVFILGFLLGAWLL